MQASKIALLLIASGIFIPLVSIPFADGYRRNADLIENIQSMSLPVTPDQYRPELRCVFTDAEVGLTAESDQKKNSAMTPSSTVTPHVTVQPDSTKRDIFDEITSTKSSAKYQTVAYGDSGKNVLFDKSTLDEEIKNVLRKGKHQIEHSPSKNLEFIGWTRSDSGIRISFPFVVGGSLLVIFAGVIILILSPRQGHSAK